MYTSAALTTTPSPAPLVAPPVTTVDPPTITYASDRLLPSAQPALPVPANRISQIAVADRYDQLIEGITCDATEVFYRQIHGGVYKSSSAAGAISGRALNDVHLRLLSDADQRYVNPDFFSEWWNHIDCALLADIVLHYFGPHVDRRLRPSRKPSMPSFHATRESRRRTRHISCP